MKEGNRVLLSTHGKSYRKECFLSYTKYDSHVDELLGRKSPGQVCTCAVRNVPLV